MEFTGWSQKLQESLKMKTWRRSKRDGMSCVTDTSPILSFVKIEGKLSALLLLSVGSYFSVLIVAPNVYLLTFKYLHLDFFL